MRKTLSTLCVLSFFIIIYVGGHAFASDEIECLERSRHLLVPEQNESIANRIITPALLDGLGEALSRVYVPLPLIHKFGTSVHEPVTILEKKIERGLWELSLLEENVGPFNREVDDNFLLNMKKELVDPIRTTLLGCEGLLKSIEKYSLYMEDFKEGEVKDVAILRDTMVWQMAMINQVVKDLESSYSREIAFHARLQTIIPNMTKRERAVYVSTFFGVLNIISSVFESSKIFYDRLQVLFFMKGENSMEDFMGKTIHFNEKSS